MRLYEIQYRVTQQNTPLRLHSGRESLTSFHVQAVVPVILVKPIDTLPLAFVNILPPTNILTSHLRGSENCVAPFVQKIVLKSSTLLQQVSN